MKRLSPLLLLALVLLPLQATAAEAIGWDFVKDGLANWQLTKEVQMAQTPDGLVIRANEDTVMLWKLPPHPAIDALTLTASADRPTTINVLWHSPASSPTQYQQVTAGLSGNLKPEPIDIGLADLPGFDPQIDQFALGLPAGSMVILKTLSFEHNGLAAKVGLWWRSLWTFDELSMTSINFLWGPRLAGSEAVLKTLYTSQPAGGLSVDWPLYALLLLALGGAGWMSRQGEKQRATILLLATMGGLWVAYDLRMSAELLGYAAKDYHDWVAAAPDKRTFRHSDDSFRVLEALPAALGGNAREYVLLTPPVFPPHFFRYATAPALPVVNPASGSTLPDWIVFHRNDIKVESGRLVTDQGTVLTASGVVKETFSPHAFHFVTHQ